VNSLNNNKKKNTHSKKNEITEYFVNKRLARSIKDTHNKTVLDKIADEELIYRDLKSFLCLRNAVFLFWETIIKLKKNCYA